MAKKNKLVNLKKALADLTAGLQRPLVNAVADLLPRSVEVEAARLGLPPNAIHPETLLPYHRARLKDPNNPGLFYRDSGRHPWVKTGYKTWSMEEWIERFQSQQPDGRHWEFFGEPIDIWEGYTEE